MLITAERVIAEGPHGAEVLAPGSLRLEGGAIAEVWQGRGPGADVTLPSGVLAPGLVDLQVNGYYGTDLVDVDEEGWRRVLERLPETGVTSFLPTFITAPVDVLAQALRKTAAMLPDLTRDAREGGARALGVHLEGPFLSARRRGAHREDWLADPDLQPLRALLEASPGLVRMMTLAPEQAGALAAIEELARTGVVASLGHSDATAAEAGAGAEAGARAVTHLFNAQRPLHHREPGLPGRALAEQRLASGLIADLHHVAADACRLAFAAAAGRVFLVTDAVSAAGMPPGQYMLGGEPIEVQAAGEPPLRPDGGLGGSGLRLDDAVRNVRDIGVDEVAAITAATRVPAEVLGREDLGRVAPGCAADLVWLSDDMRAQATWVGGNLAYARQAAAVEAKS